MICSCSRCDGGVIESDVTHVWFGEPGDYKKFNSNVGYVEGRASDDAYTRVTPQAFSHFTFEESKGKLIVVDIQVCMLV